jgi:methylmalonyl-CoA/ethylmalonyl-CoA epimerase
MTLDHIGIAVKNIEDAKNMYSKILQKASDHEEILESQKVKVAFFKTGIDSKIELLEGITMDSPISKFIEKKGEGIHHMAYLVEDIYFEIERMKKEGFVPLQDEPKIGAANKLVFFFHPKSTGGVLIEICQKRESV